MAHDAGHTEVTGVWWCDRVIGMTVASWIGGLSCGWWCDVSLNNKKERKKRLTGTAPRIMISIIVRLFTGETNHSRFTYSPHNTVVTNHPEHDPDIQHIPFFAISKEFFNSLWSTYYKRTMLLDAFAKIMIPFQYVQALYSLPALT